MSIENIIEKIRKLLARADAERNDNEHEREIALRQAHALLAKHGLEMADVDAPAEEGFGPLGQIRFEVGGAMWQSLAYGTTAELNGCYVLRRGSRRGCLIWIIGRAMRATVARAMGAYVIASIEREIKARRHEFPWQDARSFATDFGNGAVMAVRAKVAEILREQAAGKVGDEQISGERALVLVDQHRAALDEAKQLANREHKVRAARRMNVRGGDAYKAGQAFGKGLSLNAQISGGGSQKRIGGCGVSAALDRKRAERARLVAELEEARRDEARIGYRTALVTKAMRALEQWDERNPGFDGGAA